MVEKRALESIPAGKSGRLVELALESAECQRLMEMGMTPGTEVLVLKRAPLGDPIEIVVRGGHLSIRKEVACAITVSPLEQP